MKYLLRFLLATLMFPFVWTFTIIKCSWEWNFLELRVLNQDYKAIYANTMWRVFRKNVYSIAVVICMSAALTSCARGISVYQSANGKARCGNFLR